MNEIRCGSCRKLLMKSADRAIVGPVEIKCTRCGTLNNLRPIEPFSDRHERCTQGENSCGCISPKRASTA
ncbi:hypothetical protein DCO57_20670 [Labrenzia sp. 011]|nr:hypothetical protein DCO57_20670 [Labrenzia sp. 011]